MEGTRQADGRAGALARKRRARAWAWLVALSCLAAAGLNWASVPAAMLLGPMLVGMGFALRGAEIDVPRGVFFGAQAVVGTMVGATVTPSTLASLAAGWPVMLLSIALIIASGAIVGLGLLRWGSLPGNTAAWGTSPGGAAAMTAMAEAYGADIRTVAFMQYLRVFIVVLTASGVSRLLLGHAAAQAGPMWDPGFDLPPWAVAETLALIIAGAVLGPASRIPAGALVLSMLAGGALNATGAAALALPPWLLWCAYAGLGWYIGTRFTGDVVRHFLRALPQLLLGTFSLIVLCCGVAWMLTAWAGMDALSAYLATSPGGLDSVAIIAAGSGCDVPFVLAQQTMRLFAVVLTGPLVAKLVCRLSGRSARGTGE